MSPQELADLLNIVQTILDDYLVDGDDPIHLSTGLLTNKEKKSGESMDRKHSWIARNMQFDHIAILLDEPSAGTPEEGAGMFGKGHNTPLMMSHVCS